MSTDERAGLSEAPDAITIGGVGYRPGTTGYLLAQETIRLERWKAEALPVLDGLQELGKALNLPLGTRITGPDALAAAEDLADRLAAAVARAEAVVNAVEQHRIAAAGPAYVMCSCDMRRRDVPNYDAHLRAALADVPTSAPTGEAS